jgi:hypothetical protein
MESNLSQQPFGESMIREIEWKQMSMYPMAIVRLYSLFPGPIFADTKRDWAIENSPSHLIADYFRSSKSQPVHMGCLHSRIDRTGWSGEAVQRLFARSGFC